LLRKRTRSARGTCTTGKGGEKTHSKAPSELPWRPEKEFKEKRRRAEYWKGSNRSQKALCAASICQRRRHENEFLAGNKAPPRLFKATTG